jgi:hypothetical protein
MKVFAIGSIVKPLTPEQRQQIMPNEVPATLKHYLDGKIEQFWYREDKPGVIFLMNVDSVEHAMATVEALPLVWLLAQCLPTDVKSRPQANSAPSSPSRQLQFLFGLGWQFFARPFRIGSRGAPATLLEDGPRSP